MVNLTHQTLPLSVLMSAVAGPAIVLCSAICCLLVTALAPSLSHLSSRQWPISVMFVPHLLRWPAFVFQTLTVVAVVHLVLQ